MYDMCHISLSGVTAFSMLKYFVLLPGCPVNISSQVHA